jgi:hypothetical protein
VNLHVSSNSSQYGVHILLFLIHTSDAADAGIHISLVDARREAIDTARVSPVPR